MTDAIDFQEMLLKDDSKLALDLQSSDELLQQTVVPRKKPCIHFRGGLNLMLIL